MKRLSDLEIIDRLARIEEKLDRVVCELDAKADKSSIGFIKWSMGGIASLALTALLVSFKRI